MQSSVVQIVVRYVKTTLEISQTVQAYALGYIVVERPTYYGRMARMYSYTHQVKICQQPSRLLKPRCDAYLK